MKISVVTASYNSAKTIQYTLKGVLAQRYTNVEHIIKDGASTDDVLQSSETVEVEFKSARGG